MPDYTVAVLADMHGNDTALAAVLADLARHPYDALVIAGDLVLNGPHPAQTLARIRALAAPVITGNTDRFFARTHPLTDDPVVAWVRERLTSDDLDYLGTLPFARRITPPGGESPRDDLLIVHATPTDVDAVLVLEPSRTLTTITPEDEATRLLGETEANLILYGHIHYASSGTIRGQRIVSIGSVGFPFDGDPRAAYALVAWDGAQWQVAHQRVEYDQAAVIADLRASDMPRAELICRRLTTASMVVE